MWKQPIRTQNNSFLLERTSWSAGLRKVKAIAKNSNSFASLCEQLNLSLKLAIYNAMVMMHFHVLRIFAIWTNVHELCMYILHK